VSQLLEQRITKAGREMKEIIQQEQSSVESAT